MNDSDEKTGDDGTFSETDDEILPNNGFAADDESLSADDMPVEERKEE